MHDGRNSLSLVQVILDAIEQVGGIFVVTADHGNAEDMVKRDKSGKPIRDKDGNVQPLTSHTLNPVSAHFIIKRPALSICTSEFSSSY